MTLKVKLKGIKMYLIIILCFDILLNKKHKRHKTNKWLIVESKQTFA